MFFNFQTTQKIISKSITVLEKTEAQMDYLIDAVRDLEAKSSSEGNLNPKSARE